MFITPFACFNNSADVLCCAYSAARLSRTMPTMGREHQSTNVSGGSTAAAAANRARAYCWLCRERTRRSTVAAGRQGVACARAAGPPEGRGQSYPRELSDLGAGGGVRPPGRWCCGTMRYFTALSLAIRLSTSTLWGRRKRLRRAERACSEVYHTTFVQRAQRRVSSFGLRDGDSSLRSE